MTQEITLKKIMANSIMLEMCLPYLDFAEEDEKMIHILNSLSEFVYDFLHTDGRNKQRHTNAIDEAAQLYLLEYTKQIGEIETPEEARNLLTMCIGNIRRNIADFEPKTQPYYSQIYKALKIRESKEKLPKPVAIFGKWLRESTIKVSKSLTIKVQD